LSEQASNELYLLDLDGFIADAAVYVLAGLRSHCEERSDEAVQSRTRGSGVVGYRLQ
jgi:hypothetical protein